MIKAIEGIISKKEPAFVIVKTASGVSYGIFVSLFCAARLEKGQNIELNITQIIREDANLLYGFMDIAEQKMFEILIKLSGIGAATAMAVCSSLSPQSFSSAVINGDATTLQKVPGIGAKTARRIIAELSDAKLLTDTSVKEYQSEAIMALESLGFKREKIYKTLSECSSNNTSDLIKEALKKLS